MKELEINIRLTDSRAVIPQYGTENSAGADLHACLDEPVAIEPGKAVMVHTGIAMEIPDGYAGFVFARSGLATRKGIAPSNKVGVIDSDYRGEIMVSLYNHSDRPETISPGDRIAQIVIIPYIKGNWNVCMELDDTIRGSGGFGSTGK